MRDQECQDDDEYRPPTASATVVKLSIRLQRISDSGILAVEAEDH